MKSKRLAPAFPVILLLAAIALYSFCLPRLGDLREERRSAEVDLLGDMPPAIVHALSFGFVGVQADYLMLQAMTFIGERVAVQHEFSATEWQYLYRRLDLITELDPRFWDPYLLAETMLVWQAGLIEKGNTLLLKAAHNLPQDYRPYYFIGFNHFFFNRDAKKAAPYMQKAAQRPGAPFYLQGLAARLGLYGNDTANAIIFLESMQRETLDPKLRDYLQKRLTALTRIYELEKAVKQYYDNKGQLPPDLEALVTTGLIASIPEDPYGGTFVLMPNGRVYTTSKLVEMDTVKDAQAEQAP